MAYNTYLGLSAKFGERVAEIEWLLKAATSLSRSITRSLTPLYVAIIISSNFLIALLARRGFLLLGRCLGLATSPRRASSLVLLGLEKCCQLGVRIFGICALLLALLLPGRLYGNFDLVTVGVALGIFLSL